MNLADPVNATIADGQGIGTITDDDNPPAISIGDVTVAEGNSGTANAIFTVTLSAASGRTVTVDYATANGTAIAPADYAAAPLSTLDVQPGPDDADGHRPGQRRRARREQRDVLPRTSRTPANATIADPQALGTITDDDAFPTVSVSDAAVDRGRRGHR